MQHTLIHIHKIHSTHDTCTSHAAFQTNIHAHVRTHVETKPYDLTGESHLRGKSLTTLQGEMRGRALCISTRVGMRSTELFVCSRTGRPEIVALDARESARRALEDHSTRADTTYLTLHVKLWRP